MTPRAARAIKSSRRDGGYGHRGSSWPSIPPLFLVLAALLVTCMPAAAMAQPLNHNRRTPVVEVFQTARKAVVNISATRLVNVRRSIGPFHDDFFERFFLPPPAVQDKREHTSLGTGVIVHGAGYIVTNYHVISGAEEIVVVLSDNTEIDAKLLASDATADLAVLKVDSARSLPALPLGDSSDLMIGESVIAIGNPFGANHTVTTGIISNTHQDIHFDRQLVYRDLIQTDASINPGNSGGPLLNINGGWIGINTAIRSDAQGVGYAIPINELRDLIPRLLDFETRNWVVLGADVTEIAAHSRGGAARPVVRVTQVDDNSPADQAGLRSGDQIEMIDARPLEGTVDYHVRMLEHEAVQPVRFTVRRDNIELPAITFQLALREKPDGKALAERFLGISVIPMTPELAVRLNKRMTRGLLIVKIRGKSPLYRVLEPGDVIFQIGQWPVRNDEDAGLILSRARPGIRVLLGYERVTRRSIQQRHILVRLK